MSTYQKYKDKWQNCKRCKLYHRRKRVVLCRGTLPCDIMFIGEAPGLSEDSLGKPFVGPAGKLLDHIIANALQPFEDRYTFAFMNLVGCVPKDETQKKMGAPPDWVIEKCWPRLEELIAIAEPSILIAVGQLAEEWLEVDVRITHPSFILSKLGPSQRPLAIQKATYVIEDVVNHILNPPF